jgi:hypothetical protein
MDISEKSSSIKSEKVNEYWDEFISNQISEFRKLPFEQLKTFVYSTWTAFIDSVKVSMLHVTVK